MNFWCVQCWECDLFFFFRHWIQIALKRQCDRRLMMNKRQAHTQLTTESFRFFFSSSLSLSLSLYTVHSAHLWRYSNENHNLMGQKVSRCFRNGRQFIHMFIFCLFLKSNRATHTHSLSRSFYIQEFHMQIMTRVTICFFFLFSKAKNNNVTRQ